MARLTTSDAQSIGIEIAALKPDALSPDVEPAPQGSRLVRIQAADIFGFDLANMPLKGLDSGSCEQACQRTRSCMAFTFNRPNAACFLKSGGSLVVGNPAAVAGYKPDIEANLRRSRITVFDKTDLRDGDYSRLRKLKFEQCIAACEVDVRCVAFTYVRRVKSCWLKSAVSTRTVSSGAISGLKE